MKLGDVRSIDRSKIVFVICIATILLFTSPVWLIGNADGGQIDPWIYYGYALNPSSHYSVFSIGNYGYYGTRLGLILPNTFFHWLLPPVWAFGAHNIFWLLVTLFFLYLTLVKMTSEQVARIATILLLCNGHFINEMSKTYFPLSSIPYWSFSVFAMTKGCLSEDIKSKCLWWILCGSAIGGMVHSNLFGIAFLPATSFLPFFIGCRSVSIKAIFSRIFLSWIMLVLGFLLITFVFGSVSHLLFSTPLDFYSASLNFIRNVAGEVNPYKIKGYNWIFTYSGRFIIFPVIVGLMLFGIFARKILSNRKSILPISRPLVWLFGVNFLTMVICEVIGQPLFEYTFYAVYVILPCFFGLAAVLDLFMKKAGHSKVDSMAIILLTVVGFLLNTQMGGDTLAILRSSWVVLSVIPLLIILGVFFSKRFTIGSCLFLITSVLCSFVYVSSKNLGYTGLIERISSLDILSRGYEAFKVSDPTGQQLFWYDKKDPKSNFFTSLTSTHLWGYRLIGTDFGQVSCSVEKLKSSGRFAILHSEKNGSEAAFDTIDSLGIQADVIESVKIGKEKYGYWITFVRVSDRVF